MSTLQRLRQRVFPDHWTVWLGQIVVYAFVLTVLSGFYLLRFYAMPAPAPHRCGTWASSTAGCA